MALPSVEPSRDCPLCPRLKDFRDLWREREPGWFNAPVPTFLPVNGAEGVRLLIVGLAPGLRGANRTGRPFTGDYAGDLLYSTLIRFGLARGQFLARPDDGLELVGTAITNAVRCVPPENKPTGAEIVTCRQFLIARMEQLPNVKVMLALGRIAHDSTVRALGAKPTAIVFGHARRHVLEGPHGPVVLHDSYHCSRYNTNTGRLTEKMFHDVFKGVRDDLDR